MTDEPSPCAADFAGHTKHLFVDVGQRGDIERHGLPARRSVFRKLHGAAHGELTFDPARPSQVRHGIFAREGSFPCWIRFSSDTPPDFDDDKNGTNGVAIKIFGVADEPTLAGHDRDIPNVDLLLQNHPVFFVDTGRDMCMFTDLAFKGRVEEWYAANPRTRDILEAMAHRVDSLLASPYWSVLPFALGGDRAAKYLLRPVRSADLPVATGPNRLGEDLAARLRTSDAEFDLFLQVADKTGLPVDRATIEWGEAEAPPVKVARLRLARQDIRAGGQAAYGETLAFDTWRTLPANAPLGSIAESRRRAYPASAALRHAVNGESDAEPDVPRLP